MTGVMWWCSHCSDCDVSSQWCGVGNPGRATLPGLHCSSVSKWPPSATLLASPARRQRWQAVSSCLSHSQLKLSPSSVLAVKWIVCGVEVRSGRQQQQEEEGGRREEGSGIFPSVLSTRLGALQGYWPHIRWKVHPLPRTTSFFWHKI